ncbi:MAG TPA: VOC family protein [Thermoleophilia bacterium]|jgi:catechol 2,3-dioxygenase-like lactoylglutathione lyase family enzyme
MQALIEGLHHYTISVADIDESVRWYKDVLGFKLIYQNRRHDWGQVAYVQAPGFLLEMFEVPDPKPLPSYAAGPEPDTDLFVCGHKHFAILHPSVREAVKQLEALGANVGSFKEVSLEGVGTFRATFITDNGGYLIEVAEPQSSSGREEPNRATEKRPLAIMALHHVAISVPDREEAVQWYSEKFGFTVATTFEIPAIGLRSAMMQGPGFWMEIHCMAGSVPVPEERRIPATDVLTLGNKYFSLAVKDAGRAADALASTGVSIVASETTEWGHRVFVSDNSGIPIELFQLVN